MGTRVDFYVGRGESAEWLGSYPFDGNPSGTFYGHEEDLFSGTPSEVGWRQWVAHYLAEGGVRSTFPAQGWPWPWETSGTTDYAYAWDAGKIYGSCFGSEWFCVDPSDESWGEPLDEDREGSAVFPDMTAHKAVTMGPRSGLIVFGGPA